MADAAYTLLGGLLLDDTTAQYGTGPMAVAALSDGSFFAAYFHQAAGVIRTYKIRSDLGIAGTTDITPPHTGAPWSNLFAVSTVGMKLLLVDQDYNSNPGTPVVWPIDCSGAAPAVGTAMTGPTASYAWTSDSPRYLYLPSLDLVAWTFGMVTSDGDRHVTIDLLKGSTGAFVGRVPVYDWNESRYTDAIGLAANPSDPTELSVVDSSGTPWTVKIDPTAGAGSRVAPPSTTSVLTSATIPGLSDRMAAGSPYNKGLALADYNSGHYPSYDYHYALRRFPDGAAAQDVDTGNYVDWLGPAASLEMGTSLVATLLTGDISQLSTPAAQNLQMHFLGVDQAASTTALVDIALPWQHAFTSAPSTDNLPFGLAANPLTGTIIVGANVCELNGTPQRYYPQIWAIQGPTTGPNLTGKPLDSQLLFSGTGA